MAEGPAEGVFIASGGHLPAVTWDGSRYFLAWHGIDATALRAAYLTALGQGLSGETRIENAVYDWSPLSIAPIRPGLVTAAYARTTSEAPYGDVSRAFLNFMSFTPRRRAVR